MKRVVKQNWQRIIGGGLIVALFFSYQPVIGIGKLSGLNLEFSLAQIIGVVFILCQLRKIYILRRRLLRNIGTQLLFAYSLLCSVSILWAQEQGRALVIAVYAWFLFALFVAVMSFLSQKRTVGEYEKLLWYTVIFVCLFGWWQVFGDAFGTSADLTLLRPEYRSQVFGFARPQGFALEPEFFASLLIAPVLYGAWLELKKKQTLLSRIGFVLASSMAVATISRGALLALLLGGLILLCAVGPLRRKAQTAGIVLGAILGSLVLVTFAGAMNTRDTITGEATFVRTVNQLTLGTAHLSVHTSKPVQSREAKPSQEPEGYVASSTTSRLSMYDEALSIWRRDVHTLLFGVGVSNFASALQQRHPNYPPSSIVNNEYLEVLVETGVVGFVLFLCLLAVPLILAIQRRAWLWASILLAFYVQWNFFSGHANTVHVWVLLAFAWTYLGKYVANNTTG